jgi:flavin-dependent dehydrogenase
MQHIPVFIAGGGPAGIATALSLDRRGIPAIIAEPTLQPPMKAGETIPPNIMPLLNRLGLAALLDVPAHLPSYGNRFVWGQATPVDKIFLFHTEQEGWHLDRRCFEQQLRTHIIATGTQYLSGWRLSDCKPKTDGWLVVIKNAEGEERSFSCDFMVDATGRKGRITRMLGIPRYNLDKLAGINVCYHLSDNIPQYAYIEAVQDGWWYAAPLSGKRLVVSYMTDTDLLSPAFMETMDYMASVKQTTLIGPLLDHTSILSATALSVHAAATGYIKTRYGHNWLAVGDAAFAYDPISSYGITSALEGGYYGGHAIADTLTGNKEALPAYDWLISEAFAVYKEMHRQQYRLEKRWEKERFWERRMQ